MPPQPPPVTPLRRPRPTLTINTARTDDSFVPPSTISNPDRLPTPHRNHVAETAIIDSPPPLPLDYAGFPPETSLSEQDEESFLSFTPINVRAPRQVAPVSSPPQRPNASPAEDILQEELWIRRNRQRASAAGVRNLVNPETGEGVTVEQARLPHKEEMRRERIVREFEIFRDEGAGMEDRALQEEEEEEEGPEEAEWEDEDQEMEDIDDLDPPNGEHVNWELQSVTPSADVEIDLEAEPDWDDRSVEWDSDEDVLDGNNLIIDGRLRRRHVRTRSPPAISQVVNDADLIDADPLDDGNLTLHHRQHPTRAHDLAILHHLLDENDLDIDTDPLLSDPNFELSRPRLFVHRPGQNADVDSLIRPPPRMPILELLENPTPLPSLHTHRIPNVNPIPNDPEKYHRSGPYHAVLQGVVSATWAVYDGLDKMRGGYPVDPITHNPLPLPPSEPRDVDPGGINPYDEEASTEYDSGEDYLFGKANGPGPWKLGANAARRREKPRRWPGHRNKDFWFNKGGVGDYVHPAAQDVTFDDWIAGEREADHWEWLDEPEEVVEVGPGGMLRRSQKKVKVKRERMVEEDAPRKQRPRRKRAHGHPVMRMEGVRGSDDEEEEGWDRDVDVDDTFEDVQLRRGIKTPYGRLDLEHLDRDKAPERCAHHEDGGISPLALAGCDCGIEAPPTTPVDGEQFPTSQPDFSTILVTDPLAPVQPRPMIHFTEGDPKPKKEDPKPSPLPPKLFEPGWYHPWMEHSAYPGSKVYTAKQAAEEAANETEPIEQQKLMKAAVHTELSSKLVDGDDVKKEDEYVLSTPDNSTKSKRKSSLSTLKLPDCTPLLSPTPAQGYHSKKQKLDPSELAPKAKAIPKSTLAIIKGFQKPGLPSQPNKSPTAVRAKAAKDVQPAVAQTPPRPMTRSRTAAAAAKTGSATNPAPTPVRTLPTIKSIRATPKAAAGAQKGAKLGVKNTHVKETAAASKTTAAAGVKKPVTTKIGASKVAIGKSITTRTNTTNMVSTTSATTSTTTRKRTFKNPVSTAPAAAVADSDEAEDFQTTSDVASSYSKRRKGNDGQSLTVGASSVDKSPAAAASCTSMEDQKTNSQGGNVQAEQAMLGYMRPTRAAKARAVIMIGANGRERAGRRGKGRK